MWIIGINLLVGFAMFVLVLGLSYLLSLFLVRIRLLPPSPYGDTPRAQRHGRARQIAGVQAVNGVFAALAALMMTAVVLPVVIFTPLLIPIVFLIGFPLEYAVEVAGLPRTIATALFVAIPVMPIHVIAQCCAYGVTVRHVKWLAAS